MKLRPGYLVALAALVVTGTVIGVAVRNSKREKPQPPPSRPSQEMETLDKARLDLDDVQLNDYDENGDLVWSVKSHGSIELDRATMSARGTDIFWELRRGEEDVLTVVAPSFLIDYTAKKIRFEDGVESHSSLEGFEFKAEAVSYDMGTQRLRADGDIQAKFRDYSLRAGALAFGRVDETLNLTDDVELRYAQYVGTAKNVVIDKPANRATLTGGARVEGGGYSGRADRIEVDGEKKQVRLTGSVAISRGALRAQSAKALLDRKAQRAEMRGGVKLVGEGFTARGQKLVLDAAKSTATMSGGVKFSTTR